MSEDSQYDLLSLYRTILDTYTRVLHSELAENAKIKRRLGDSLIALRRWTCDTEDPATKSSRPALLIRLGEISDPLLVFRFEDYDTEDEDDEEQDAVKQDARSKKPVEQGTSPTILPDCNSETFLETLRQGSGDFNSETFLETLRQGSGDFNSETIFETLRKSREKKPKIDEDGTIILPDFNPKTILELLYQGEKKSKIAAMMMYYIYNDLFLLYYTLHSFVLGSWCKVAGKNKDFAFAARLHREQVDDLEELSKVLDVLLPYDGDSGGDSGGGGVKVVKHTHCDF